MSNYDNIINILESVGLNESYYFKMSMYDSVFAQWQYKKPKYWNQFGGADVRKIMSNGIEYKFYKRRNHREIIYTLHSKDNDILKCIMIIINKKSKTAYIHELGNEKGCIKIGHIKEKGGSILMNVALELVNRIKEKYNLEYVYLTDNATKTFHDNNNDPFDINLSNLLFFTKGKTYYEKFGFLPVSESMGIVSIDEDLIENYMEQKNNIMKKSIHDIKVNFKNFYDKIDKKYHHLIDNIKKNKEHKKAKKVGIHSFISYYANKKDYIPIIQELLIRIVNGNNINLPKKWGMKLF